MTFDPDHFLQTDAGRVVTPGRNRVAWAQSYRALEEALATDPPPPMVYVLVGPQGAGKSTWVKAHETVHPDAVFFDAILVKRSERHEVLARTRRFGTPVTAVWMRTPLKACLERNRGRPLDELVDEQAIRNVFAALEPPDLDEGFAQVIEVT